MAQDYDSAVPEVRDLSAPSPLRSEVIAAFNAILRRIEALEDHQQVVEANRLCRQKGV